MVTRSTRIDGSPTVPARWLTRIETLLSAHNGGRDVLNRWAGEREKWLAGKMRLMPEAMYRLTAPAPVTLGKPDRFSVTEIGFIARSLRHLCPANIGAFGARTA